ncbi:nSTAND1 domain-containing NTPase [Amycolatopsis kentuckyensis]|uniref:nSTAND1 domain-containing NTPase n=1 Tax=Amycolatopsis kentuckyensis TaxID=218823 RepID=UPI000A3D2173|nr:ATP-binding protein [Amycolatopsis kentuckyensis]
MSDAAGGRKLPTRAVALAYVRACDGPVAEWDKRWHEVAAELSRRRRATPGSEPPYPGLAAFGAGDAGRFFGREDVVDLLRGRLAEARFLVVSGPSGSGVTSVLRAGLVHRARRPVVFLRPGRRPLEECAARLAALTGTPAVRLRGELAADPGHLHLRIRQAVPPEAEFLLVVDQFEEVFTAEADERAWFFAALLRAAQAPVRVVLGLRADHADACARHPALAEVMRNALIPLEPLTAGQVRAALVRPAADAGRGLENALVATLMAEVARQPAALPFATEALRRTWQASQGVTLTLAAYEAAGGITAALAGAAEAVYGRLAPPEQAEARSLFLRLVGFGDGTPDTRRHVPHAELDPTPVVARFVRSRLVTAGQAGLELAHDALIDGWPRLRGWLAADRDALRVHRRLTEATALWETSDREPAVLYRGRQLDEALKWAKRGGARLNTSEHRFLQASVALRAAGESADRRRRRLSVATALTALLAAVSTATAIHHRRRDGASRVSTSI